MHAKSLYSCPSLCNSMDYSPPGSLTRGFSRQEYWSGLSFPSPGDLPEPGTEPASLMSPVLDGRFFTTSTTWEALSVSSSVVSNSLESLHPYELSSTRLLCPWNSPGKNTGVHGHSLLQGIFLTQGLELF